MDIDKWGTVTMKFLGQKKHPTRLLNAIQICLISLMAASVTGYASTTASDRTGIRIVGRIADGSIVLDGSNSSLAGWESQSIIKRARSQHLSASELVAIGTVDALDLSTNTLTVAGQSAVISETTQLIDALSGTSSLFNANAKRSLDIGDHVAIAGDITGPGKSVARFVVLMATAAAPGTSLIYVRGVIEKTDLLRKGLVIGNLAIDFNVIGNPSERDNLANGDIIEAIGYSAGSGQFTATDLSNLTSIETDSTSHLNLQGIHGSGLKGIHGSGLKGIHGSGLKGIHGSGLKGIHGSGLKGIHGSGLKGTSPTETASQ